KPRATRASCPFTIAGMAGESAIRPHIEGQLHTRFLDQAIARLALGQHGVVARRQLLAIGMGSGAITVRLERGQLHELHRGVYVVGFRRISQKVRWMAAVLASGDGAVLSHCSAARLWRLIPPKVERIDVTAPGRQVRREGIEAHRGRLQEDEWLVRDGIPVTSPFRTIFDLAAVLKMRELERAFHEAEAREVTDRVSLPVLLERYPGRRGSKSLRALLEARQPVGITRNDFEEAFVALVDRFDLQRPRMNAPLAIRGRFFAVDALWKRERVAVELDSRGIHGTRKKFESNRQRDRILVAEGWRTMRVTWRQLQEEPAAIARDLRLALGNATVVGRT
ncbi:MAG: type IV toxin-antitoxin system AbiEi family antitoxin domain-containing protein, partial [Gammaproteobacteria bacterium]